MSTFSHKPTLHLLCGKIAAGKSTLSARLIEAPNTILVSEDSWLAALYGEQMQSVADYVACSNKLKNALTPHLISLLQNGLSVVLDFPANTLANRQWMKTVIDQAGVDNRLHYLDVPDEVCRERLRARNSSGTHDFAATDAQFDLITRYFVAPEEREGFTIIRYS
ncbi:Predicted kinase [Cedecea lapagei]|uniref:Predicted kinase n=2 Tax=Cedecea lapagei TaxID=158823 RepID=A0A447V286_9ENTR|nr:Predicted kinase [Cedecea lapagei]